MVKHEIFEIVKQSVQEIAACYSNLYTCNGTPGWRCVAFIDMTDTSYNCPTGLNLTSYSNTSACGRSHTNSGECSSTTFSVGGLPYSRVCGRIKGYQFGATNAFWINVMDIDSYYVDGVSLTHREPGSRQHIWTFAAGLSEKTSKDNVNQLCSCDTYTYSVILPLVEMITFVRVFFTFHGIVHMHLLSIPMILCGTVRIAQLTAHVVSSTILHGLQRTCLILQQMILN